MENYFVVNLETGKMELHFTRERYAELMGNKDYLLSVARSGAEKARAIARRTLSKVYRKVGLVEG